MKNNKAGFSLVELMVVVSIIAILASIAVPNFSKMSSRAKQTAARVELSGVYTSEQAFYAEYSTYHPNLAYIGYVPDGWKLVSTTSCPEVADLAAGTGPQNVRYYTVGFKAGGGYTNMTFQTAPTGAPADSSGNANCSGTDGSGTSYYDGTVPGSSATITDLNGVGGQTAAVSASNAFIAMAAGMVSPGGTRTDVWTVNASKKIQNVQSGI